MTKEQFFAHCVLKLGPPKRTHDPEHIDAYWAEVYAFRGAYNSLLLTYVHWQIWWEAQAAEQEVP